MDINGLQKWYSHRSRNLNYKGSPPLSMCPAVCGQPRAGRTMFCKTIQLIIATPVVGAGSIPPVASENAVADPPLLVDVDVADRCDETHNRGTDWVVFFEL